MTQSIKPGEGLDGIKLDDELYNVVNRFKHEDLNIIYSAKHYLDVPIKVEIKSLGVNLLFKKDRLILIELADFSTLQYSYNSINLNHVFESKGNHLKIIYNKIFGPTYPGKLINGYYLLSYPGISFKFELSPKTQKESPELADLLNSNDDIKCKEMFIFNSNSYDEFLEQLSSKDVESSNSSATSVSVVKEATRSFKIKCNIKLGITKLSFNSHELTIKIGKTTQQEILNFLGPPDDYFNKFDSRLSIHNNLIKQVNNSNLNNNKILKFHNYYKFGIDFLYDLNDNGVLNKIILYNGNLIESSNFGHWNKCNYEIYLGNDSSTQNPFDPYDLKIGSGCYFSQIPGDFKTSTSDPIFLNRSESELINLDVIPINELSNWGQSKLYCYDHCIWEILNNDCVSCVTIY